MMTDGGTDRTGYMHTHPCKYTCTHVSTCTHTHVHMYTHTCTHTHVHMYTHVYMYTHMYTQTHMYTHTCTHTCTNVHTYTHVHTHTHVHVHTHIHTHIHTHVYTHVHTHIYIHTHITHMCTRTHVQTTCVHTQPLLDEDLVVEVFLGQLPHAVPEQKQVLRPPHLSDRCSHHSYGLHHQILLCVGLHPKDHLSLLGEEKVRMELRVGVSLDQLREDTNELQSGGLGRRR